MRNIFSLTKPLFSLTKPPFSLTKPPFSLTKLSRSEILTIVWILSKYFKIFILFILIYFLFIILFEKYFNNLLSTQPSYSAYSYLIYNRFQKCSNLTTRVAAPTGWLEHRAPLRTYRARRHPNRLHRDLRGGIASCASETQSHPYRQWAIASISRCNPHCWE